jgi:hypothetical protein
MTTDELRAAFDKATTALSKIKELNQLRNDYDAYLFALSEWGLGMRQEEPKPRDYGLREYEGLRYDR